MLRLLSILLLAVTGLPLALPLLSLGQGADAGLPACCRRMGKHHCMMSMEERSRLTSHDPRFTTPVERCPYTPGVVAPAQPNPLTEPPLAAAIFGDLVRHPAGVAQTEARRRIARDRSHQKRGPPALFLL